LSAVARASAAATSMSCALVGLTTAGGGAGTGPFAALAAVFLGGVGRTGEPAAFVAVLLAPAGTAGAAADGEATNASLSRRATGASMVLDADFTYSPISFNLARTVLLSTPSSFASSCTRGLPATALLISRPAGQTRSTSLGHLKPDHFCDFIVCSCVSSYLA
jgi:hypothetical protein